jgi:hypothetical protein
MSVLRVLKQGLKHSTDLSEDRVRWFNVKKAVTRVWVPESVVK